MDCRSRPVKDTAASLDELTPEIRANFNRLREFADEMHKDLAITASMRAVMEAVADRGEQPYRKLHGGSASHANTSR